MKGSGTASPTARAKPRAVVRQSLIQCPPDWQREALVMLRARKPRVTPIRRQTKINLYAIFTLTGFHKSLLQSERDGNMQGEQLRGGVSHHTVSNLLVNECGFKVCHTPSPIATTAEISHRLISTAKPHLSQATSIVIP